MDDVKVNDEVEATYSLVGEDEVRGVGEWLRVVAVGTTLGGKIVVVVENTLGITGMKDPATLRPWVEPEPIAGSIDWWTDEKVAELRRRWEAGETATTILQGTGWATTRNAVIAKAHRLGLEAKR